jgi:hypothetical protein
MPSSMRATICFWRPRTDSNPRASKLRHGSVLISSPSVRARLPDSFQDALFKA